MIVRLYVLVTDINFFLAFMKMINLVIMYTTTHLSMDEQGIVSVFMHSVDCQLKLG